MEYTIDRIAIENDVFLIRDDTKQDLLISGKNIKTINGESVLGSGDIKFPPNVIKITYNELGGMVARGLLEPGQLYGIADYNTLVNQSGIYSLQAIIAEEDVLEIRNLLIVEAISENELSENAKLLRWFEPVGGIWTPDLELNFVHLQEIQEIDVKYDPYWDFYTQTAYEKSKVTWVPKFAYDSNTNEGQGVFFTHVDLTIPTSIGGIHIKQFLTYTGVNFIGQIGQNGIPQKFWEFASGDIKYYLQSDKLRYPALGEFAYSITKLATEEGQINTLEPSGYSFNDTTFTGYIYHAKDKCGNEAPYDFGCILKDASWIRDVPNNISSFSSPETTTIIADYISDNFPTAYLSTFVWGDLPAIFTPFYYQEYWRNNVIKEVNTVSTGLKIEIDSNFIHIMAGPGFSCTDNYIGMNSYHVIMVGATIQNNTVGSGLDIFMLDPMYNKIGHDNGSVVIITGNNTIGNGNTYISLFGDNNIVSDYCGNIVINQGHLNKVGSHCQSISFGSACSENIIEDGCGKIIFGNNYSRNTIHSGSVEISFVDSNYGTLNNVRFCNIGKNCFRILLCYFGPMTNSDYVQNIEVEDGVNFYASEQKLIEIPAINNDYKIRVGNDTLGVTKVWNGAGATGSAGYPIVEHGLPETSAIITPNTFHIWGVMNELSISLEEPENNSIANEYIFQFISSDTGTTLTLPPFQWSSEPIINPNCTYQVSILNNCVTLLEFEPLP